MVQAQINITEHTNRILNIVKAQYGLQDKSQAINLVVTRFEEDVMEPEFRPEFIAKIRRIEQGKTIPIKDFATHFGRKRVRH